MAPDSRVKNGTLEDSAVRDGAVKLEGLPPNVATVLSGFIQAAQNAYSSDLVSVVLYGSGAEGKLSPTSDVNLLLVLRSFSQEKTSQIRDAFLAAEAAIQLRAMFLLEEEISSAVEFFAQKFADILRRHKVLLGKDVFSQVHIPRAAEIFRLRQILLNLVLRLREMYLSRSQRPEQVVRLLAETAGPLRAAAGTLLELEGAPGAGSGALESVAASFGGESSRIVAAMAAARERQTSAAPPEALFQAIELVGRIAERAARLR